MTNKERLISLLGFQPDQDSLNGTLIDYNVEPAGTYVAAQVIPLKKCELALLELLISTPDQTNENGFVIKYDRGAILSKINRLKGELGLIPDVEGGSKIQNRSYLW